MSKEISQTELYAKDLAEIYKKEKAKRKELEKVNRQLKKERALLDKTLNTTTKVLSEILKIVNPAAFDRASRVRKYVVQIILKLKLQNTWQIEMAALLSQIGFIALPPKILDKIYNQQILTDNEFRLYKKYPTIGKKLIEDIPNLETVAEIIQLQNKPYNEYPSIKNLSKDEKHILLGAQILKVVLSYDEMITRGISKKTAISILRKKEAEFNTQIVLFLESIQVEKTGEIIRLVYIDELDTNMITDESIFGKDGRELLASNQEMTEMLIKRLQYYAKTVGVVQPFKVIVK